MFDHCGQYHLVRCINCGDETTKGQYCTKCFNAFKKLNDNKRISDFLKG